MHGGCCAQCCRPALESRGGRRSKRRALQLLAAPPGQCDRARQGLRRLQLAQSAARTDRLRARITRGHGRASQRVVRVPSPVGVPIMLRWRRRVCPASCGWGWRGRAGLQWRVWQGVGGMGALNAVMGGASSRAPAERGTGRSEQGAPPGPGRISQASGTRWVAHEETPRRISTGAVFRFPCRIFQARRRRHRPQVQSAVRLLRAQPAAGRRAPVTARSRRTLVCMRARPWCAAATTTGPHTCMRSRGEWLGGSVSHYTAPCSGGFRDVRAHCKDTDPPKWP